MKRIFRNDMTPAQKAKISYSLQGRKQSTETKEKISKSMTRYWSRLPYKPITSISGTTTTS